VTGLRQRHADNSRSANRRPTLGILDFNPIQYHTPLYQLLDRRGNISLDVLFLSDRGYRETMDSGFGVPVAWDLDLLSGYSYHFLSNAVQSTGIGGNIISLTRWIRSHDVILIHGYSAPWMLIAAVISRITKTPYLMRGDSGPQGRSTGLRRQLRNLCARTIVRSSAAGLAVGQLNHQFYQQYGAPIVTFAPHSLDNERFACAPKLATSDLLAKWKLHDDKPVIIFCGKLSHRKRPLDLSAAVGLLPRDVITLYVGDGVLAEQVRASLRPGMGVVTGFVNQSELPAYYHAAEVLVLPSEVEPWGLVVNEAMAAGVLPVVSDRVGAAPDLVSGVGEIYRCGDVVGLAAALTRALERSKDPRVRDEVRRRVARHSLACTAVGFEQAVLMVSGARTSTITPG
jgi:glycosyltransferase involved in cell wall biosynthesis